MKVSISLIVGLVLGWTQIVAQSLDKCDLNKLRFRKNIRKLTDDQWNRYVNAVKKVNSGNRLTTWDNFVKYHIDNYRLVHYIAGVKKPLFLVWHRLYLYYLEKELQKVDATVTIPYWDWTVHSNDLKNDVVLSDRFFGGQSVDRSECIVNGKFKDFKVGIISGGQTGNFCIMRGNEIFNKTFTDADTLDLGYINAKSLSEFERIEINPHGSVHMGIGGQFGSHASSGDPLFYSHHAFIDKTWFDWQNRHIDISNDHETPNLRIPPWNIRVKEVVNPLDHLCVAYKQEHFSWSGPNLKVNTRSAAPDVDVVAEKYIVPTNITDPKAILEYDRNYIMKGLMDYSKIQTNANITPIPDPVPAKSIKITGFTLAQYRESERKDAILIDSINKIKMFN